MLSWALAEDFQGVCGVFQEVVYCYNVLMQSVRLFFHLMFYHPKTKTVNSITFKSGSNVIVRAAC